MKNKVALSLTLAFASIAAQAQNKGMDIGLGPANPAAQPKPVAVAQPQPVASTQPAANLQALNQPASRPATAAVKQEPAAKIELPAKPAQVVDAAPVAAPVAKKLDRASAPAAPVRATRAVPPPTPVVREAEVAPVPPVAPTQRIVAQTPAPVAVQRQASIEGETNPFTGKGLSAEYRQRQLEEAKMDTDLIQEKLKQANLIADLTYLPLKKKAEVSALPGIAVAANSSAAAAAVKPASANQAGTESTEGSSKPVVHKPVKKPKVTKKVEPAQPTPPPVPTAPTITISGISINGAHASAIIETEAGVLSAQSGDSTPFGQLRVIDQRTVSLGGRTYAVRNAMLSRMMVSDPVYVDPEKARNATQAMVPVAPPANIPLPPLPPLPAPPKNLAASRAPTPGM